MKIVLLTTLTLSVLFLEGFSHHISSSEKKVTPQLEEQTTQPEPPSNDTERSNTRDQSSADDSSQTATNNDEESESSESWKEQAKYSAFWRGLTTLLGVLVGTGVTAFITYQNWITQHLNEKWYTLIEKSLENPEFMVEESTRDYRNKFSDSKELARYEMFARMYIAFVDHMANSRPKELNNEYCGTGKLFAGRHLSWLQDNRDSYNEKIPKLG